MLTEEMLTDEVLRQAAEQYAEAVINSLPTPEECNHKFSKQFEEKMQSLLQSKTLCIISPECISK